MTPGFQVAVSRLEGQWRNLFWRIHRMRRSAAISREMVSDTNFYRSLFLEL